MPREGGTIKGPAFRGPFFKDYIDVWLGVTNRSITSPAPPPSGSLVHGQSVTITGTGFGTKSRALSPLVQDYGQDGVGNISSQYIIRSPNWAYPGFTNNNIFNRDPATFSPTGATIGPPHPFVQCILAGCHYNGQPNTFDSASFYVGAKYLNIPAFPWVAYFRSYKRADPNTSFTPGESTNDQNYKGSGWADTGGVPSNYTYFGPNVATLINNTIPTAQYTMQSNASIIEDPDRNGHIHYWNQGLSPFHAPNGWIFEEVEVCMHQGTGPSGLGYVTVRHGGTTLVINYAGCTDQISNVSRVFSLGGGVFYRNFGPGFNNNTAAVNNWEYIADIVVDATGGGVSGHCARVIWGNATTLAASTIRSYMDITAWVNTSIIGVFRKDRFSTGQTAYAHVVTESAGILDNRKSGVVA